MPSHTYHENLQLTIHRLILTYLIPCHLLTTHTLPTDTLLAPYPRLQNLFLPLSRCIKKGDLSGFDAALAAGEDEFVKRRIYLTLERGRDIALRNLLRKVFLAGGFEEAKDANTPPVRRTRIRTAEFGAAISIGGKETMDDDEVECLLATMIYKVRLSFYSFCFFMICQAAVAFLRSSPLSFLPHSYWPEDFGLRGVRGHSHGAVRAVHSLSNDSITILMVCTIESNERIHSAGARLCGAE